MGVACNPACVTSWLVLYLDAGNVKSYPGSGVTWTDLSGYGNVGTLTNGPIYNSANGGSIVFDGVNEYVTTQASASASYTISICFQIISFTSADMRLFGAYSGATNQLASGFTGSTFRVWIAGWQNLSIVCSTNVIYNITITYANSIFKYYLNGSYISSLSTASDLFNNMGIGNTYILSYGSYFNGNIYNFLIYDRQISDAEVTQNFNALRGRYGL
jgi:hypothetical protein